MKKQILLTNLKKISLNQWYSQSMHWSERDRIKKDYAWNIRSQTKIKLKRDRKYHVEYHFTFKNNPLDASNTIAMAKIIEDCLFESDKYDIVKDIKLSSRKGKENFVRIVVYDDEKIL